MSSQKVLVHAVGDIDIEREDADSIFDQVRSTIKQADIAFCQLETTLSERGSTQRHSRAPQRAHPRAAKAITNAGFHVVGFASNHCMDWGVEAFLDTIDAVKSNGMQPAGVGRNIAEARTPVIIERRGIRVAFLSYCSVLPRGYWADESRPGAVPLRAHTIYEPIEPDQPGTACRIHTFTHRDDLGAMVEDIKKAKAISALVMVSHHWGIHIRPAVLAQYQKEAAHAAIDAGADIVLGHHTHILKGIEVYKGKAIIYSMGNFAFEEPPPKENYKTSQVQEIVQAYEWDLLKMLEEYPWYPFPPDARKTILVKILVSEQKIEKVSYLPVFINPDSRPQILSRSDRRSEEVFRYVEEISRSESLNVSFVWDGDEVVIIG